MKLAVRDTIQMRTLGKEDAPAVFAVIDENRAYLRQWLPWVDGTDSVAVIQKVITKWEEDEKNGTELVMGIFKGEQYIGNIGLHDLKRHNHSAMIGYWLAQSEQGGGVMTDCVRALTDFGFREMPLNRIYIRCAEQNQKSSAIPQRLGFRMEGLLRDEEILYGQYFNLAVYGMLKRQWIAL